MKIISNHRDFYDCFARDRSVSDQAYVWDRKTRTQKIGFSIPRQVYGGGSSVFSNGKWIRDHEVLGFVVWFCGNPVPVVKVVRASGNSSSSSAEFFYSFDSLPDNVRGEKKKGEKKKGGRCWRSSFFSDPYGSLEQLFELGKPGGWENSRMEKVTISGRTFPKKSVSDMHLEVKSPVFCHSFAIDEHMDSDQEVVGEPPKGELWRPSVACVLVNPCLSNIQFHRHVDPFSAFLSLEQYVSNQMAPKDSRMDQPVPDKINAESHGFDKASFRKEPSTKKKRRKS